MFRAAAAASRQAAVDWQFVGRGAGKQWLARSLARPIERAGARRRACGDKSDAIGKSPPLRGLAPAPPQTRSGQ